MERVTVRCGCVVETPDFRTIARRGMFGAASVPVTIKRPCDKHR